MDKDMQKARKGIRNAEQKITLDAAKYSNRNHATDGNVVKGGRIGRTR